MEVKSLPRPIKETYTTYWQFGDKADLSSEMLSNSTALVSPLMKAMVSLEPGAFPPVNLKA